MSATTCGFLDTWKASDGSERSAVCQGERTHEKGACRECGARPCAYCDERATRRWSPPELGGYCVSVCAAHHASMAEERREALSRVHQKAVQP